MSFIEIKNLTKIYNSSQKEVKALNNISISFDRGEFIAIMGHSGSGKSTMLTVLGVLNPPTCGEITIDNIPIYNLSSEKQADFRYEKLGFVFQQHCLIPYLTAIENVMLPLSVSKDTKKQKLQKAQKSLDRLGLSDKARRLPAELSGGEQARVAIARAIVNNPPVILADEPTGNLDTKTGEEVMRVFENLNKNGQTIIMVTHNPENTKFANRIVRIKDGQIEN